VNKPVDLTSKKYIWEDGQSYKKAKIKLKSGEMIKGKHVTVKSPNLYIETSIPSISDTLNLDEVEELLIPTKSYGTTGFLLGTLLGVGLTYVGIELFGKRPGPYTVTVFTTYGGVGKIPATPKYGPKELDKRYQICIVAGGSIIGVIIGSKIKGGWKKVFPFENEKGNDEHLEKKK